MRLYIGNWNQRVVHKFNMPKIHVLHVIDGLKIGGAEILLRELSEGLLKKDFRVSVAYSTPGPILGDLKALGVELIFIPRLFRVDPYQFYNMYRSIKKVNPTIVHTHLFKSDFQARPAARLAQVPVVVSTLHSIDRWAENRLLGKLYGLTARYADKVIAVSDKVRDFHVVNTGISPKKLVTIENGVDANKYASINSLNSGIRKEFSIPKEAIVYGIIGRLTQPKGHETFLISAKMILEKVPQAIFLVVGDGPLRDKLIQLADELAIREKIIFTGFRNDIPEILAALDVLVISSHWEGLPVILLEGMAASKPVVATAVGGIPSVVTKESAFIVPPADPSALAMDCIKLANSVELRKSFGKAGYERVLKNYSLDAMVDRTVSLYMDLLHAQGLTRFESTLTDNNNDSL